jgi:hypothetical protein
MPVHMTWWEAADLSGLQGADVFALCLLAREMPAAPLPFAAR